jgi:hypothetical protein
MNVIFYLNLFIARSFTKIGASPSVNLYKTCHKKFQRGKTEKYPNFTSITRLEYFGCMLQLILLKSLIDKHNAILRHNQEKSLFFRLKSLAE